MAAKVKSYVESVGLAVHKEEEGEGLESLGAVLTGRPYVIGSCPLKTCRLAPVTLALVERPYWTAAMLERLVGLWARTAARAELAAAAYCAPLMVTYLESLWARQAFTTDSNDVGYGVAVTQEDAWQEGCGGYAHDIDELAQAAAPVTRGPSGRAFRFLYLFAGVRRPGDLEEHLRRRAKSAGILIEVWSLDAIIDPKRDRTDPEFLSVIARLVDKGYFHGVLASPPRSTWSRARFRGHEPRPLRTHAEPWERADIRLTSWERRQLELETKSLMTALTVIRAVCTAGGAGLSERPSDPGEPPYPSIWDLVELKDLVKDFGGWVNYLDHVPLRRPLQDADHGRHLRHIRQ
ncbi:unnamed protein product, partial [Prorocentrum cordatum]